MPLLTRGALGLGLSVLLGSGCFSEPTGNSSGATESSAETSDSTSALVTGTSPLPPGDESAGCNDGCLDPTNNGCLFGRTDDACGASGEECIACADDRYCDEGSCSPIPLCTADNCAGCCDGDVCISGLDQDACGRDGQQCTICVDETACIGGGCRLPCADNCAGCCDASGDCIPLEDVRDSACGMEGESCAACPDEFSCSEGVCISTACAMTCDGCCDGTECLEGNAVDVCGIEGAACESCPPGTQCSSGCRAAPGSVWDVVIISAELPPELPSGASWDSFGGAPDPILDFEVADASGSTLVLDNTYLPTWNEVVASGLTTEELLEEATYTIRDADVIGSELAGTCNFSLSDDLFGSLLTADCVDGQGTVLWTLVFAVLATE